MAHGYYTSIEHRPKKKKVLFVDKFIYLAAIIAPIMTIPQLADIWVYQKVQGVSLTTWASYTVFSFCWLVYGLYHKEMPIILSNITFVFLDAFIVVGVLVYS